MRIARIIFARLIGGFALTLLLIVAVVVAAVDLIIDQRRSIDRSYAGHLHMRASFLLK